MNFEFATATRIVFGAGKLAEAGRIAGTLGKRAIIVIGKSGGAIQRAEPLLYQLDECATFSVAGEPTFDDVRIGAQRARDEQCDFVISFGGGSVIDTGKAIAMLLANDGEPLDYAEVIGRGQSIIKPSAPFVAIPTTAGTGAEVTRNAVLGSLEHHVNPAQGGVKVSLRSSLMLPRVALVDPELTYELPPVITARTGLDALTQLIEPFVSNKANPMTDALCRDGMQRVARSLRRAFEHGDDPAAREDMSLAALFSGMALANAALGAVHGFAAALGGMFDTPHGALCAALLPHAMRVNVRALAAGDEDGARRVRLQRFDEVARILTGNNRATAVDGVAWVSDLCRALGVVGLSKYGVRREHFPILIEKAKASNSMKGNPIALSDD